MSSVLCVLPAIARLSRERIRVDFVVLCRWPNINPGFWTRDFQLALTFLAMQLMGPLAESERESAFHWNVEKLVLVLCTSSITLAKCDWLVNTLCRLKTYSSDHVQGAIVWTCFISLTLPARLALHIMQATLRACLHGGGAPQVGEVTHWSGVTRLSI